MFDVSFPELVLIAIVGLLVIGPDKLPDALRTLGLWLGRMRRSFVKVKAEIEKEIGMDEVRRQLHNEAILEEMKRIETEVKNTASKAQASLNEGARAAEPKPPVIDPRVQDNVSDLLAAQSGQVESSPLPEDAGDGPAAPGEHTEAVARERLDDRDHTDAAEPMGEEDHTDGTDPIVPARNRGARDAS